MNVHVAKAGESTQQSMTDEAAAQLKGGESSLQFVDQRPTSVAQRRLQSMASDSPRAQKGKQIQRMADSSPRGQRQAIQKKENKTGLPDNLKSGVERLSGYSMDAVRVHYNSDKPSQLQAHAYAQGTDIHLAPGQEKHLPHEAWHVVQQAQGRVRPTLQMKGDVPVNDSSSLESEADAMGARAFAAGSADVAQRQGNGVSSDEGSGARLTTLGETTAGGVKQLLTYKQLSDTQQYQIDAIADDVYRMKAEAFEDRLGVVASAHPLAQAAGNRMLTAIALANPGAALQINAQLNTPGRAQATYIGANLAAAAQANVAGAQNETWQEVGGPQVHPIAPGGVVDQDTYYAIAARANHVVVRGGGSTPAARVFLEAQAEGANPAQFGEAKVLALSLLAPPRAHSFHEVMLAALDVGLPYAPGPQGYRQIAPLTQPDIGLHFPDFFRSPEFLIQLAHYFFPGAPAERATAQTHFPANVLAHVQAINLRQAHDDAALQPLLVAGIARNLLDAIPAAQLAQLSTFVTANTIATHANWLAVQGDPVYTAVSAAAGARVAQLIFAHLEQAHRGGAGIHTYLNRAQNTLTGAPVAAPNNLFNAFQHAATTNRFNQNRLAYPNQDRDVDMNQTALNLVAANLSHDEATAINEYTGNNFGNWHTLMGASNVTPQQFLNGLPDNPARERQVATAEAALTGLRKLPVYGAPVFRGTSRIQGPLQNVGARNAAMAQFGVGNVVNPQIQLGAGFLSASKTIGNSFIGPMDFAFVIDNVQTGHDIQLLSGIPTEREVLFEPQARFVVTRVEDRLIPSALVPNNFTGGQLYIYLKEISAAKSVAETTARDNAFQAAFENERDGRRLIDRAMYDPAQIAYHNETAPTQDPKHRFAANWGTAGQMPQTNMHNDWANGDVFIRAHLNAPLLPAEILQLHALAGASVAANPGALRATDVWATSSLDQNGNVVPNGLFTALDNNELAVLQANPQMNVQAVPIVAAPPLPPHLAGKTHIALVRYTQVAQVPAALNTWHGQYVNRFNTLQAQMIITRNEVMRFASRAQRRFISIHPFDDGNGRTSRLIMDHILLSFGYEPAIVADPNQDTGSLINQWQQHVDQGVTYTENLFHEYNG